MMQHIYRYPVRWTLFTLWVALLLLHPNTTDLLHGYGLFSLLGVVGAIFANSTGAGGGVIFVPFFNQLHFDSSTTVATSFAIQCCGMTAGAITWWLFYRQHHQHDGDWQDVKQTLLLTIPASVAGIWLAQWYQASHGGVGESQRLHLAFGLFSIALSLAIFSTIRNLSKITFKQQLCPIDKYSLPVVSLLGGGITAYLSIGVGELIAVLLIIRGFNVTFAIAMAVILSAFSVWSAIIYHAVISHAVYWPVVLFAGAGAVIGGVLAKRLVLYFNVIHLKVFFATWVFLLGVSAIPF